MEPRQDSSGHRAPPAPPPGVRAGRGSARSGRTRADPSPGSGRCASDTSRSRGARRPRSWCARPRCSATGRGSCTSSLRRWRFAATTAASATSTTSPLVRWCSLPMASFEGSARHWARRVSRWWSPTRHNCAKNPLSLHRRGPCAAVPTCNDTPRPGNRDPRRESAHRAVVDPRLDDPGPARSRWNAFGALSPSPHRARNRGGGDRALVRTRCGRSSCAEKKRAYLIAPDLPERTVTDLAVPLTTEQVSLIRGEGTRGAPHHRHEKSGIERQGLVLRLPHRAEADL